MIPTSKALYIFYQVAIQLPTDLLLKLGTVGLILVVTWIVSRLLGSFVSKAVGKFGSGVARQARDIVTWLVWIIGILIGLNQLGLELTVLLLIVTLGGIIIAIALRDVLLNVASNGVITSYKPFKVGDWIKVDNCFGRVLDINWMETVLMTPDNETVYVPNSKITQNIIVNKTTPGGTRIAISIVISRALDLSEIEKALLDIGSELKEELIPEFVPEVRVTHLNTQSVRLALLLRINNPAKGKLLASDVRKKAKKRLDAIQSKTSP